MNSARPVLPAAPAKFFFSRLVGLVVTSAVLVIALGIFAYSSLTTLNQGTEWVVHAQKVRYELSSVLQLLVDMGGGVRRFEMTRDESVFAESSAAAAALPVELAGLHRILADDPQLQPYEARLRDAIRQRELQVQNTMDMARAGNFDGIHDATEHGDNVRVLDACRDLIAEMQAEENRLYERHRSASAAARDTVAFAIVATTALAVILLLLVAFVSMRHATTLRETDRRKDVFLATLSHELRNPLAPIRNAARLLDLPGISPEEMRRSRAIISRQVRHMASLLDDLLDISRITRGMLTLKKEIVGLKGVFEAAVESARPAIDAKRHVIEVQWPDDTVQINADPVRLTQIVTNVLTNAAKYTDPDGYIALGSHLEGSTIVIYVRDNGIGLAPHMLHKVFEMFSQVAPTAGHADGGLGIGLALVKGLIDLHGGRIEALSQGLECGCEFVMYFPDSFVEPAPSAVSNDAASAAVKRALRVLVADDNRDSAESLGMLLEMSGHQVFIAYDGLDAVAVASKNLPDAALLDIGMPGMDGYEVAASLRREPWGADMTLIAITGWGQEEAKRLAREAGFDHHLTKPMDSAVLESLLESVARA